MLHKTRIITSKTASRLPVCGCDIMCCVFTVVVQVARFMSTHKPHPTVVNFGANIGACSLYFAGMGARVVGQAWQHPSSADSMSAALVSLRLRSSRRKGTFMFFNAACTRIASIEYGRRRAEKWRRAWCVSCSRSQAVFKLRQGEN